MVHKKVEFPWNVTNSENYIVLQASMQDFQYFYTLGECVLSCLLIYETTVVLLLDIMTQEWHMCCLAFFNIK